MKMKKSLVFAFAILFLIVNGVLVSAITGSMGNSRMILYPEVNGWTNTVIEKTILVKNVNDVAINITLVPDQNATEFVELIDETFILEPGEERKAEFQVKVRLEGRYEGRINVFFSLVEGEGPGVVLSSTIIVIAKKDQGYEETSDETTNEDNTTNEDGAGEVILDNENSGKISNVIKFWGISTIVLIIVLLVLLYIWNKKRNKSKKRKNKFK